MLVTKKTCTIVKKSINLSTCIYALLYSRHLHFVTLYLVVLYHLVHVFCILINIIFTLFQQCLSPLYFTKLYIYIHAVVKYVAYKWQTRPIVAHYYNQNESSPALMIIILCFRYWQATSGYSKKLTTTGPQNFLSS